MFTTRHVSIVLGFVLTLMGLFGLFMPNSLVGVSGMIKTNMIHDLVHLITGGLLLYGSYIAVGKEASLVKMVGVIYLVLTVLGFVMGGTSILGLIEVSETGKIFNTIITVLMLGVTLGKSDKITA